MSRKLPTVHDVARLAGVSPATVSNALGGRRAVAPELVARVRQAAQDLGYVKDSAASRLRSRQPAVVGALVPEIVNPFFAAFVDALETLARRDGLELVLASSGGDPAQEASRLRALVAWRPAGVVVLPCDDAFTARRVALDARVPMVVADRLPEAPEFDLVAVDNAAAAARATRHLLQGGSQRILVVASTRSISNVRERIAGVREAVAESGDAAAFEVLEAGFDPETVHHALRRRLAAAPPPDAVFALNVAATLGASRTLAEAGLTVPADVALVGFDDYDWMRIASPPITAVRQPIAALAEAAWERLTARVAGDTTPPCEVRLDCSLELRASSAAPVSTAPTVARPSSDGIARSTSGRTSMAITRRSALTLATGIIAAGTLPGMARLAVAQDKPEIVTVVKIGGIPWFNAMEVGIKKEGEALGVDASMIGPTQADAAQQVRAVEDLIARKVDVIAVVPNDATALEPVFKRAQEAGIKVLTHESPDQKFNDWNVELTTVDGFGETHMEALAKAMGGEGKYIVYVGSLTVPLHNKWADAAIALQKEKYPKMELVADRFGVAESLDDSYKTALDQMRANPDLKGILAFGSQGPIGAARAVEEKGKMESIAVVGPFSPGQGAKFIKSGAIREGFIWNPMQAGETIVFIGNMLAKGETPTDGMELPGLGKVSVNPETRNILAQKLQPINKDTIDGLVAMGL